VTPGSEYCPHAPSCAPCPLRGLPYRSQLARKRTLVQAALEAAPILGGLMPENVVGSRDLFGYRHVAKLAVRARRDGTLRAGVYAPGTHRLVDAERCAAQHPALSEVLAAVLQEASRLRIAAYDERRHVGELRYLVARYGSWRRRVQLVLVTTRRETDRLRELSRRVARRCRVLGGIVHNYNPERGNVIFGSTFATLRPPAVLVERIGELELEASPGSFLQVNPWTARRIYETALEWAAPEPEARALDLYCGVGPLSLSLATRAAFVVGIEESPRAIADARANQRRNRRYNLRFEQGDAAAAIARLGATIGAIDIVTLNPTRKGASTVVLEAIAAAHPRRIVYVSCEPRTLARDLERLAELGYRTARVRLFDMLPQTEHVEAVSLLVPRGHAEDVPVER
jgi:23S rRNA (uracil1939-C5)-methyltransferase